MPGIDAIGGQVRQRTRFLPMKNPYSHETCSWSCGLDTNVVILQLEDPFGYDRADIKVDAIVEDLRVRTTLSSPTFAASSLANPQAQSSKSNAELS